MRPVTVADVFAYHAELDRKAGVGPEVFGPPSPLRVAMNGMDRMQQLAQYDAQVISGYNESLRALTSTLPPEMSNAYLPEKPRRGPSGGGVLGSIGRSWGW